MGNYCTTHRERDMSLFIERMLELQRELVIKEIDLESTQKKLAYANRVIEVNKIEDWTNSATTSSRKRNNY